MKVITPGRNRSVWVKKVTCTGKGNGGGGCEAKLLVEQPDLFTTKSYTRDNETEVFVTFICCQCCARTDLKNKDVPLNIANSLPDEKQWRSRKSFE